MVKFAADLTKLKARELLAINRGDADKLAEVMARFMVDDNGQPMEQGAALDALLDLNVIEFGQAQDDFLAELARAKQSTVA